MKKILFSSFLLFCCMSLASSNSILTVNNIRDSKGKILKADEYYAVTWYQCEAQQADNSQYKDMFRWAQNTTYEYQEDFVVGAEIPELLKNLDPNFVRELSIKRNLSCLECCCSCWYNQEEKEL